jgi:hypothetical protein
MPEKPPCAKQAVFFNKLAAQLSSAWLACYKNLKQKIKKFFLQTLFFLYKPLLYCSL